MTIRDYIESKSPAERTDYERDIFGKTFCEVASRLPYVESDAEPMFDVWTDGELILCRTEALADTVANMLEFITGESEAHTGYYDPEEDKRSGEVDNHTGWWYVDYD